MFFELKEYNQEYYRIYKKRRETPLAELPSFRWIKEALALKDGDRLLDAGCGEGGVLDFLCQDREVKATGVDCSAIAIEQAQVFSPQNHYCHADLTSLPFPDAAFEKIVCYNVIEHIRDQDLAMRELKRVLVPGGVIVLGTNIRDSICWWLYQKLIGEHTHTREFSIREFREFVGSHFDITDLEKSSGVFRIPAPFRWVFHYILKGDVLIRATGACET